MVNFVSFSQFCVFIKCTSENVTLFVSYILNNNNENFNDDDGYDEEDDSHNTEFQIVPYCYNLF
jgi:hypothetical protein